METDVPRSQTGAFLFTDIEGSTRLWERHLEAMAAAHTLHDKILADAIETWGGTRYLVAGDAVKAVFPLVDAAIAAAIEAQRAFGTIEWPMPDPLRVRMAIQLATVEPGPIGEYRAPELSVLESLLACGHGGQILVSRLAAEASTRDVSLLDLGRYRLPGTSRAESIFQVVFDGGRTRVPPLSAPRGTSTNLRPAPNPLIGRKRELQELRALIFDRGARLVTLTGAGGIGKTRLAHQLALDLADEREETVWFVDLTATSNPQLVVSTIATTLQVPEMGYASSMDALVHSLGAVDTLLILDNFEHVLPAADDIAELLARQSRVRVLATSRSPLRIRGEWQFPVEPLSLPATVNASWEELSSSEAVRLFVDRAVTAAPEFTFGRQNAVPVAEICRKLEGLPLAIELAAPRIRILSAEALSERLDNRLGSVAGDDSEQPSRHRAMRASIAWSYDLLSSESQRLFRQMGVLQSGFTLDTLEGLLEGQGLDVLEHVELLVEQNLVRSGGLQREADRFVMMESVRQFALERLELEGELHAMQERHARFFSAMALDRYPDQRDYDAGAIELLAPVAEDLRVAIDWLTKSDRQHALSVAAGAWRLWFVIGRPSAADRSHQAVIAATEEFHSIDRVRALYGAALLRHVMANYEAAIDFNEHSLALADAIGDRRGIGDACNHLAGMVAMTTGDIDRAIALVERALEAYGRIGDLHGEAESLLNRASMAHDQGRLDDALIDGQRVLAYCRAEGKDVLASNTLHGVAGIAILAGQLELARTLLIEGLVLSRRLGYDIFLSANISVLTSLLLESDRYAEALCLAEFARVFTADVPPGSDVSDPFHWIERERLEMLANLSPDDAERAIATGARLTPEEAVTHALHLLGAGGSSASVGMKGIRSGRDDRGDS